MPKNRKNHGESLPPVEGPKMESFPGVEASLDEKLPSSLPVLPLSDVVVFPFMMAPLLVSSRSSIQLIDEVVAGNRLLVMSLQKHPETEEPNSKDLHEHGCSARVLKMLKFPDDTVRVLVQGMKRVKIVKYETDTPFIRAQIQPMEDEASKGIEVEALARNATRQFQEIINLSPNLPDELKIAVLNIDDAGKLSDLIAANLNVPLVDKQKFLETTNVKNRLTKLSMVLRKELDVLQLGTEIQNKASVALSKSQREYFLREQMRQIQKELGEESPDTELRDLRDKVEKLGMTDEAKKVALKELDRLNNIPPASAEYTVSRTYLDWIMSMPWSQHTEDNLDIGRARKILDEDHYGLEKVKERILEHLAILNLKY
jgi:ATP-dependent Lon protease